MLSYVLIGKEIISLKSELELLEERIAILKKAQESCEHEWLEPEPDTYRLAIYEDCWLGDNVFSVPSGKFEDVPCMSRMCYKCGKKEYSFAPKEDVIPTRK